MSHIPAWDNIRLVLRFPHSGKNNIMSRTLDQGVQYIFPFLVSKVVDA